LISGNKGNGFSLFPKELEMVRCFKLLGMAVRFKSILNFGNRYFSVAAEFCGSCCALNKFGFANKSCRCEYGLFC